MMAQHHHRKHPRPLQKWDPPLKDDPEFCLADLFGRISGPETEQSPFLRGGCFHLRLEHRQGGDIARHPGEERLLLFRSHRAIAKIIFSSAQNHTKIHVLEVKADYRGWDLGSVLFAEATNDLARRCGDDGEIECQLDAEEDVRRHDRLLQFYHKLGCEVKPNAKIRYINNNDGETYRKIPMIIRLFQQERPRSSLLGSQFLPIQLREAEGSKVLLSDGGPSHRQLDWLLVEDGIGRLHFRSTLGHILRDDDDGRCFATLQYDEECFFLLHRVCDEEADRHDPHSDGVRGKELWMLRQSIDGRFLAMDGQSLAFSKVPSFWRADASTLSLTFTSDTSLRRRHYRQCWIKQTVAYIQQMHQRYLKFELATMTLRQALDLIQGVPCRPFRLNSKGPSMRTLCFQMAEYARNDGQPDWVQMVALVHELGNVVSLLDTSASSESDEGYQWTIASRSRVVGCATPGRGSFREFRYPNSEPCEFVTPLGMYDSHCGLENTMLAWTGPEYLFHMLKHNTKLIPDEGMSMLRYYALVDWHAHNEYAHLTNDHDEEMKPFVAEFDVLRRATRKDCVDDLSNEECDKLWEEHYSQIAAKYGLLGILNF